MIFVGDEPLSETLGTTHPFRGENEFSMYALIVVEYNCWFNL